MPPETNRAYLSRVLELSELPKLLHKLEKIPAPALRRLFPAVLVAVAAEIMTPPTAPETDLYELARVRLLHSSQHLIDAGKSFVASVRNWLPIAGKPWDCAGVKDVSAAQREAAGTHYQFSAMLCKCLILTRQLELIGAGDGRVEKIVNKFLNVDASDFENALSWNLKIAASLRLAIEVVVVNYKPFETQYGSGLALDGTWDAGTVIDSQAIEGLEPRP